jgi:hypothetical protein
LLLGDAARSTINDARQHPLPDHRGALVAVGLLGYQLYEAKKEPKGVQLSIGERGISLETR